MANRRALNPSSTASLHEIAWLFLKLGTIAGPAAHIAMMEEEVVRSGRGNRRLGSSKYFSMTANGQMVESLVLVYSLAALPDWYGQTMLSRYIFPMPLKVDRIR